MAHIDREYIVKSRQYSNFKSAFLHIYKKNNFTKDSQLLFINHPVSHLTQGYDHWSKGLITLTAGYSQHKIVITHKKWHSDLFSKKIWDKLKDGTGFRKRAVGFDLEKPIHVFLFLNDKFIATNYLYTKKDESYILLNTNLNIKSDILIKSLKSQSIDHYIKQKNIDTNTIVKLKEYPHFN
jgi:hypothetical protein